MNILPPKPPPKPPLPPNPPSSPNLPPPRPPPNGPPIPLPPPDLPRSGPNSPGGGISSPHLSLSPLLTSPLPTPPRGLPPTPGNIPPPPTPSGEGPTGSHLDPGGWIEPPGPSRSGSPKPRPRRESNMGWLKSISIPPPSLVGLNDPGGRRDARGSRSLCPTEAGFRPDGLTLLILSRRGSPVLGTVGRAGEGSPPRGAPAGGGARRSEPDASLYPGIDKPGSSLEMMLRLYFSTNSLTLKGLCSAFD